MAELTYPLQFFESHRITLPEGGVFYDAEGLPVIEDTLESVMRKMGAPQVAAKAKATSSGVLINGRVYPGVKMKESTHHFTRHHGKPVLSRHPIDSRDHPERVGRITSAEYIQTWTDKLWMTDFKSPKPNGHPGSGHIILGTLISGQENVERVMDKRDLTLSVGFTPTAFFCSICGHDWVADGGPCGHEPLKVYELDSAKRKGVYLCFGITGHLLYDHVANVNFPADPTARFLSASFQDAAESMDYLTSRAVESYQSQLAGFVLTDASNNRALELQLDAPPSPAYEAPNRKDEAQLSVAVEVDLGQDAYKETPMKPETTTATPPAQTDDVKPDEAAATDAQVTDVTEGGQTQDSAGAWTLPDPVDGHTHGVAALDDQGNGRTTMDAGKDMPAHDHEIKYGRVKPYSGGSDNDSEAAYVSRHPHTYFYDAEGKPAVKFVDETNDVDGKPQFTDEQDHAAAAQTTDQGEVDCVDGCTFDFQADDLEQEFVLSDELEDAVEQMGAPEMADMIEETDLHTSGQLTDAPLTAAQRKKIPTRLFCGPNRTFPAHDKARVRNGLSRLPQAKNFSSAEKARILSCLKRRAKALGIEVSGTDGAQIQNPVLMDGPDQAILKTLGRDIETKGVQIGQLQSSLDERTKEVEALNTKLQDAETQNIKMLIDQIITSKFALRKPDMVACKTQEDIQKVRDELAQRSVDSLSDFARELQLELASGGGAGAIVSPAATPPESGVGSLGAAPTPQAGEDGRTLADQTLERFKRQ